MTTTHYSVSASVGVGARALRPTTVVMDTGAGFALIKKSMLPANWGGLEVNSTNLPRLGDANGNALHLEAMVHLIIRLGNTLYRVPPAERFRVFLSNFSKSPPRLPKGMVIGYANRTPIPIVLPSRDVAEECGKVLNLTILPASSSPEFEIENSTWDDSVKISKLGTRSSQY